MGSRSSRRCSRLISLNVRDRCVRRGSIQYITSRRKRAPRAPHTTSRWTPKRASSPPNLLVGEHLLAQHARAPCRAARSDRAASLKQPTCSWERSSCSQRMRSCRKARSKRASSPPDLLVGEHLLAQHAHRVEQLARTALQACNMLVGEEHLLA